MKYFLQKNNFIALVIVFLLQLWYNILKLNALRRKFRFAAINSGFRRGFQCVAG